MLDKWIDSVCQELGLDPADVDRKLILDLARDVAHGVARPAAPLTTYLLGLAVGRGASGEATAGRIVALTEGWTAPEDGRAPGRSSGEAG
ncbi:DUF6457 domain-containing protein [Actinomadura alba]|uniref:DUF6457 domain-containing protein n=1 Tax=Actinomadura alba TaxID=406431 RepID=UPI0028ABBC2B|nr:DUF6457 domain-containing protein [Actinomadura alba]